MSRSSIFLFAILICAPILILAVAPDVIAAPADLCGDTCWVGHDSGAVGSTVAIPVTFKNCAELGGVVIPLKWNPDLVTLDSIDFTGSRVEYVVSKSHDDAIDNDANTVTLFVLVVDEEPLAVGEGLFATLRFYVDASSDEPVIIDTTFIPPAGSYIFSEPDATPVPTEFMPGSITVVCDCGRWGDVNADGQVNPVDVVFMVNYVYLGKDMVVPYPNCPYDAGDVNCDGQRNPVDVVFYVRYTYHGRDMFCPDPCGP